MLCWWSIVLTSSALVGKFIWAWAELALLSLFPSSEPTRPEPTRPEPTGKVSKQHFKHYFLSQTYCTSWAHYIWNTTSNFCQMEDDLNFFSNGRRPQFFFQMEEDIIFFKWKTTSIFFTWKMASFFSNRRWPQFFKWKTTLIFFKWKMTSFFI